MKVQLTKEELFHEIILNCKANNVYIGGDLVFALAFRTRSELVKMCQEMHIKTVK
jgi:hypothetical protein